MDNLGSRADRRSTMAISMPMRSDGALGRDALLTRSFDTMADAITRTHYLYSVARLLDVLKVRSSAVSLKNQRCASEHVAISMLMRSGGALGRDALLTRSLDAMAGAITGTHYCAQ